MMKKIAVIERGDLFCYDFGMRDGSLQRGRRPVLVIQDTEFNRRAPTILVAAITTVMKKPYLPCHIFLGAHYGLVRPSMVLLEQIFSVNKKNLGDYIGHLNNRAIWERIDGVLGMTFGLQKGNKPVGDIRCLCRKCLSDYFQDASYLIYRVDPYQEHRERCDKCDNLGFDYVIARRE